MGTLYLVSTPIGNLSDLSPRGARTLGSVSRVLAEDTRRTRTLLHHLDLQTPTVSLHAHNEASREAAVLAWLGSGEDLALVSDAGTPLVSDPGRRIVAAALEAGHAVVPIPGASAVLAALVGSGLLEDHFSFLGFPPRKGKARAVMMDRVSGSTHPVVLFESPERLRALLGDLADACGPERRCAVARELTKLHEEFIRGSLADVRRHFDVEDPRGEITMVVAGAPGSAADPEADRDAVLALARSLLARGASPSRAAKDVARRLSLPRNLVYSLIQDLGTGSKDSE
jgi:16S rRNA (cytidine1402-2'-O)-methyltransferase